MKPTGYVSKSPLVESAEAYVSALVVGSEIRDDQDECIVGQFRHLIKPLLRLRGLDIDDSAPGVWLVVERPRPSMSYENNRLSGWWCDHKRALA